MTILFGLFIALCGPAAAGAAGNSAPSSTVYPAPSFTKIDPTNQSVRDLKLGFDVIDTLSFGVGYEGEVAKDINLNRIEIRDYPQPDMTVAP